MRMRMLDLLHDVIHRLPRLLTEDRGAWRSVNVTYHRPHVERLWMQLGKCRVLLHRIHPCDEGHALFHPHPWPSAVRLVGGGAYEMGVSGEYFPEDEHSEPGPAWTSQHAKILLQPGCEYEMTERQGWHYVRPVDRASDSVMVTGPLYDPPVRMPSPPAKKQEALSPERFDELLEVWKAKFPA